MAFQFMFMRIPACWKIDFSCHDEIRRYDFREVCRPMRLLQEIYIRQDNSFAVDVVAVRRGGKLLYCFHAAFISVLYGFELRSDGMGSHAGPFC